MMSLKALTSEIKQLPVSERLALLDVIADSLREELSSPLPVHSVSGKQLLAFAGTISPEDGQRMMEAIEQDCEQVDIDE
jgi:hypothetical protein